ncbi:hypothetical protein M413DRAFT_246638 [Hebeloma cylindrosporum]|uniref:Uncharacterized protein n=1 Tax=Hebeloma cylindrosporum TaxID=76867 RepID=A0A0C3C1P3_HEBCY|nr:hypothetical protein M413DRAFT_246638 [Hebeloma cylindrosporum h7]
MGKRWYAGYDVCWGVRIRSSRLGVGQFYRVEVRLEFSLGRSTFNPMLTFPFVIEFWQAGTTGRKKKLRNSLIYLSITSSHSKKSTKVLFKIFTLGDNQAPLLRISLQA